MFLYLQRMCLSLKTLFPGIFLNSLYTLSQALQIKCWSKGETRPRAPPPSLFCPIISQHRYNINLLSNSIFLTLVNYQRGCVVVYFLTVGHSKIFDVNLLDIILLPLLSLFSLHGLLRIKNCSVNVTSI